VETEETVKSAKWKTVKIIIFRFVLIFFLSSISQVVYYKYFPPVYTYLMVKRKIESKPGSDLKYRWRSYENISTNLKYAVISSEDQKFMSHYGVDFKSIRKAWSQNQRGKRIKGASTITQQVAKNLFLWPGRSYVRKIFELYYAVLMETFWSKEDILEMYLNIAEMGELTFGAESASRYYFKKPSGSLGRSESAAIAAILPNPIKYKANNPNSYVQKRKAWILRQMNGLTRENLP
jgi:monofunctional glycosyltransferase